MNERVKQFRQLLAHGIVLSFDDRILYRKKDELYLMYAGDQTEIPLNEEESQNVIQNIIIDAGLN